MPIVNNNFQPSTYVNSGPPALDATEQNAIVQTISKAQVIRGATAPSTSTTGTVGQWYLNTTTLILYLCTAAGATYTWLPIATPTELSYIAGVTSGVQAQINTLTTAVGGKQKTITSGTATPTGGSSGDIYLQYGV